MQYDAHIIAWRQWRDAMYCRRVFHENVEANFGALP